MKPFLERIFPIVGWISTYRLSDLRGDLTAGLTVGVMLVPQSMAYALLAGMPPIYGLYASVVPLVVYALLGTSRHLSVGTVALDMLLVYGALSVLATPGSQEYIQLALLLTALVGLIQLAMALFRLGFLVNFLSRPVIAGFTSAASIIIGLSQLKNLLGIPITSAPRVHELFWNVLQEIDKIHWPTFLIGTSGIILLYGIKRWKPTLPGPLIAVTLAALAVWKFKLYTYGVAIVGEIPRGLPDVGLPPVSLERTSQLLPSAVALALVQFMNVISLGKTFAFRFGYSINANRELLAIGSANFLGSFFKALPVSGSFSRTAVNVQTGARTPLSNVFTASVVFLTLLYLTPLFYYLPIPIFASIVMVAAFGMVDIQELRYLLHAKRIDGLIALLTFLSTLFIGIQQGILIGIGLSVLAILYRISRPHVAILGHIPDTQEYRDIRRFPEEEVLPGVAILRIDASFGFANAEFLKDFIARVVKEAKEPLKAIVIDASSVNDIDLTALEALDSIARFLREKDIELYITGAKGPVRDVFARTGFIERLGRDHFFLSLHRAVEHLMKKYDLQFRSLEKASNAAGSE